MSSFPTDEAHLASLFSESVLYGLFIATFIGLLRAVLLRGATFRAAAPVRWSLLAVACAMFVVASVDIALNLLHDLNAFIYYQGPGGPIGEFSKISHWIQITRPCLFALQVLIGDGMLIYRTFVVYGHNYWIVAFPVLLWLGVGVSGFAIPVIEADFKDAQVGITVDRLNMWTNAAVSLTLGLNVIGTLLISFKIWSVSRRSRCLLAPGCAPPPGEYALRLVIETGALYTTCAGILLGTSVAKHNSQYIVSDAMVPIIGICFNLLIVRASWHAASAAQCDIDFDAASVPIRFTARSGGRDSAGTTDSEAFAEKVVSPSATRKATLARKHSDKEQAQRPLSVHMARETACDVPADQAECSRTTSRGSDVEAGAWAQ